MDAPVGNCCISHDRTTSTLMSDEWNQQVIPLQILEQELPDKMKVRRSGQRHYIPEIVRYLLTTDGQVDVISERPSSHAYRVREFTSIVYVLGNGIALAPSDNVVDNSIIRVRDIDCSSSVFRSTHSLVLIRCSPTEL